MKCFETDTLVQLGAALEWNPDAALQHLATCSACGEQLKRLATLHAVLDTGIEPASGFTDAVLDSLRSDKAAEMKGRSWLTGIVNSGLAAMAAFFSMALGAAAGGPMRPGPSVILVSLIVAGVTLWWNWIHESTSNRRVPHAGLI